ncbi:MAG: glycosyltransferase family 2 protein [Cyclobacteriaceae bacterium]
MKSLGINYSVVIPVFNSEKTVTEVVGRIEYFFQEQNLTYEIILINDGSTDNSWMLLKELSKIHPQIMAINFLKNYGQHSAIYCGIAHSKGDYIIMIDDDLQNPPEEMIHLIDKVNEGYDAVFAEYRTKRHGPIRLLGTKLIDYWNQKIFKKDRGLKLTNFRIISREVGERITNYKTVYPYIPGLILMFANNTANVVTEHHERLEGRSNYTLVKILHLVARLLFNYSSYPLKVLTIIGFIISFSSFGLGLFYTVKGLIVKSQVLGFTTIIAAISFLCGFIIIMLGIIGEYISRLMNQMSASSMYHIKEIVKSGAS